MWARCRLNELYLFGDKYDRFCILFFLILFKDAS